MPLLCGILTRCLLDKVKKYSYKQIPSLYSAVVGLIYFYFLFLLLFLFLIKQL